MSALQIIAKRFKIADPKTQLLNKGGMGNVYWGIDLDTQQKVAIKSLKPTLVAEDAKLVDRLIREGEVLQQLSHPNIVKMIAAVEDQGRHYLVMEYVSGVSLRDRLKENGVFSVERSIEIGIDLADALSHAHRQGIIHRDMKPSNVLLNEAGVPYLTDFGVAYIAGSDRLTQTGMRVGTVNYFSPEACNGEMLDRRADVWGLGIILYEMLTGARPFRGTSVGATAVAIISQPIPDLKRFRPQIPQALVDLIYCMLEKDRDKRIPSMRLVQDGLKLESTLIERGRG
ncbi:MAG TPA: serine/threonine protein kinase [Chloroflexi bacterium]|nr:serine/threonine protein kinase [Chloroflexota bacterium]